MRSFLCILLSVLMLLPLLVACTPKEDPSSIDELYRRALTEELFTSSELMVSCDTLLSLEQSRVLAGSCAYDGVLYYALSTGNGQAQICRRTLGSEKVETGPSQPLGDAISMCYNTADNRLIVAHGDTTLSVVDPETLEVVSTHTVSKAVIAIAYNASENGYMVRTPGKNTLQLLDAQYAPQRITSLPDGSEELSISDLANDDKYIYILLDDQHNSEGALCTGVLIYDPATKACYRNVLDLPIDRARAVSLSVSGSVLLVGLYDGNGDRFISGTPVLADEADKPSDLLARRLHALVTNTGISSEFLFNVYEIADALGPNNVMQGGCTDGKYGYFCMEDQANNYVETSLHRTRIVKVDLTDNSLVAVSERLPLDHSNDMCYNSRLNKLIVVHCGKDDASRKISFLDPEALEIIDYKELSFGFYCMAYDEVNDRYMVGNNGRNFAILDSDFNVLVPRVNVGDASYCQEENLITQGSDCDSEYVYVVLGGHDGSGPWTNYLVAYDWSGNRVMVKIIPNMTAESENIFHIGTTFYVGCNGGNDPVYRVDISE